MTSIISYLENMLAFVPVSLAIIVVIRIFRVRELRRKGIIFSGARELLLCIFFVYVFLILSQTVFNDMDTFLSEGHMLINTKPFNFVYYCRSLEYLIVNVLGNIVLFIPAGLFIPFLWRGNAFFTGVGGGLVFSLCIEILQLPLLRTTDVDDLMLNTAGAFIGFLIYRAVIKRSPALREKFRIKKQPSK